MVPKSKPYDDLPTALREKEIEKERVIQKKTDRQFAISLLNEGLQRLDKKANLAKEISNVKFNPTSEPRFFNILDRLNKAD